MKAYPTYKDSGVQWLGNIPTHWKTEKLTAHFQFGKGLSITKADLQEKGIPVISYGQIHSRINNGVDVNDRLIRYVDARYKDSAPKALVNFNDIVFADTSEDVKGIGNCVRISCESDIFAGYHTIIAFNKGKINTKYWAYLFQSDNWKNQLRIRTNGVKVFSISQKNLRRCNLITPPVDEQQSIVAYLDKKCAEIDELVSRRQSIIERLKELKQSIIANAVTKGLNPDVPMKDSGIAWLGEVPQHWNIERLQWHLCEIKEINSPIKTNRVLSLTNKKGVIPYEEKGNQGNKAKTSYDEYKLAYPDTLVMNSMNVIIGSVGICNYFGCVSPVYYIFKTAGETMLSFVNYVFQTTKFQKELRRHAKGILEIRLRLSSGDILKRLVAFPPLPEQKAIVTYLDKKCAEIDELVARQEQIIEKLKELKTSTIANVVTGKVDVRESI